MPLGYTAGKWFRLNYAYDRYAETEAWKKLVRYAGQRGLSVHIDYSHTGRNFVAEIKKFQGYGSGYAYYVSAALRNHASPMIAMTQAFADVMAKDAEPFDLLMRVLILECEAQSLVFALEDAKAAEALAEKRAATEYKLNKALAVLRTALDGIGVTFMQGDRVVSTAKIGELRSKTITGISMPDETLNDEDDARLAELKAHIANPAVKITPRAVPAAPGEDDDL